MAINSPNNLQYVQQAVHVQTVLPVKKKEKTRKSCFYCIGIFLLAVIFAIATYAVIVFMNKDGISYRSREYDYAYNYNAITVGPWLSDNELMADFVYRKKILEEAGVPMNGDYYKQVLEMDYETYLLEYSGGVANEIYNAESKYSFTLDKADKYKELKEVYEISGLKYTSVFYCYLLDQDKDYEDLRCGKGKVNVFSILIFTDWQYNEYKTSPTASGELIGQGNGFVYIMEHVNGELPVEVGVPSEIYTQIKTTFKVR